MSTESIERSKQEARDYEEIGDYFSEIVENNSDRYSFEWGISTSANAKMESLLDILYLQEYHKIRKGKQTFHLFKKGVCCEKSFRRITKTKRY